MKRTFAALQGLGNFGLKADLLYTTVSDTTGLTELWPKNIIDLEVNRIA